MMSMALFLKPTFGLSKDAENPSTLAFWVALTQTSPKKPSKQRHPKSPPTDHSAEHKHGIFIVEVVHWHCRTLPWEYFTIKKHGIVFHLVFLFETSLRWELTRQVIQKNSGTLTRHANAPGTAIATIFHCRLVQHSHFLGVEKIWKCERNGSTSKKHDSLLTFPTWVESRHYGTVSKAVWQWFHIAQKDRNHKFLTIMIPFLLPKCLNIQTSYHP